MERDPLSVGDPLPKSQTFLMNKTAKCQRTKFVLYPHFVAFQEKCFYFFWEKRVRTFLLSEALKYNILIVFIFANLLNEGFAEVFERREMHAKFSVISVWSTFFPLDIFNEYKDEVSITLHHFDLLLTWSKSFLS